MISLCSGWEFSYKWSDEFLRFQGSAETVRLPHNIKELPLHYAAPEDYETVCGYRRHMFIEEAWREKRIFLQFDGAAHIATVYANGCEVCTHRCGYTAFRAEITDFVTFGAENEIAVRLDCTENGEIPPFGLVIDYLTYGGLYREAWLDVREQSYIADMFVMADEHKNVKVGLSVAGCAELSYIRIMDGDRCLTQVGRSREFSVRDARLWTLEEPKLYTCEAHLTNGDTKCVSFGFRSAKFEKDGFYLNGEKIFLRGLNRHQSYPYMGYAATESLQREDARILKRELACNAVRTSHYPQSQHFIDECDRLGLLVFTEIPGWQHVGDEKWQEQAIENVREMVVQYRNHPSIILWGVRINESQDFDGFYAQTNDICRRLDPTRQTSGVRFLEKSSLLEDIYAFNDFSHNGKNGGVRRKKHVTPDMEKPLLISEHNGHMFPTKAFDPWEKRQEQALRHARVLSDANDGEHCGCFGWCMFDYATHKDFGSGDRICYHGVMDSFRNPKPAAALYASQGMEAPVLEVGSPMDIGDYAAGQIGKFYVFTNADKVKLYKNGIFVTDIEKSEFTGLPHGPMAVEDTIGELLKTQEGFTGTKERLMHAALVSAQKYGLNMPIGDKLKMVWCMLRYSMSFADGYALYGKYVGNWGGEATRWRFDAIKDGRVVSSVTKAPGRMLRLEVKTGSTCLKEGDCYDMAAVRVRILDENGSLAAYSQLPVSFTLTGNAELIGPSTVTAEGGMCGTYLRTAGESGAAELEISAPGVESVKINFTVEK